MTDNLTWVVTTDRLPGDDQPVFVRNKSGAIQKVVYHLLPSPRWMGMGIAYRFDHFREWAPRDTQATALKRFA